MNALNFLQHADFNGFFSNNKIHISNQRSYKLDTYLISISFRSDDELFIRYDLNLYERKISQVKVSEIKILEISMGYSESKGVHIVIERTTENVRKS